MLEVIEELDLGERDKAHRRAFAIRVQSAACLTQERYEEALSLALQSLQLFESCQGDLDDLASTWELLAESYRGLGDQGKASGAQQRAEQLYQRLKAGEPGLQGA